MCLILMSAPKVEKMALTISHSSDTNRLISLIKVATRLQEEAAASTMAFNQSNSVVLSTANRVVRLEISNLPSFFLMRSVTHAAFRGVCLCDESPNQETLPLITTKILSLGSVSGPYAFRCLLAGFKSVRKFSYVPTCTTKHKTNLFFARDVGESIVHFKHCLEDLTISDEYIEQHSDPDLQRRKLGSLANFEKLHTITISVRVLFGPPDRKESDQLSDLLPKSLKRLELLGSDRRLLKQLIPTDSTRGEARGFGSGPGTAETSFV